MNRLATAFSLITGTRCSTCIKYLEIVGSATTPPINLEVVTLVRDDTSQSCGRANRSVRDSLASNTGFLQIQSTAREYFYSNYLPAVLDYKNSSFERYGYPVPQNLSRGTAYPFALVSRDISWHLPYKSTIVVPISSRLYESTAQQRKVTSAYLCIDSMARFPFRPRHDVELLKNVAQLLYPTVKRYTQITSRKRRNQLAK